MITYTERKAITMTRIQSLIQVIEETPEKDEFLQDLLQKLNIALQKRVSGSVA